MEMFVKKMVPGACWLLFLASSSQAATWDLTTDWSNFDNPNGSWTYGYYDFQNQFTSFDQNMVWIVGSTPAWTDSSITPAISPIPGMGKSTDPVLADFPIGKVGGHTPSGNNGLAVQWKSPMTGTVEITGGFWQMENYPAFPSERIHDYVVFKNGTPLHAAPIPEYEAASSTNPIPLRLTNVAVANNDIIELRVLNPSVMGQTQGFIGMDFSITDDLTSTTQWNLTNDFGSNISSLGISPYPTSEGIGPDGAWTYGYLDSGNTEPFVDSVPQWIITSRSHVWAETTLGDSNANIPAVAAVPSNRNGLNDDPTGDFPARSIGIHTPSAAESQDKTSVFEWKSPRNMTVDVTGTLWRLMDDGRTHGYELRHKGTSLTSGEIGELSTGVNSDDPTFFQSKSISVSQDDVLQLLISPLSESVEGFVGLDMTVTKASDVVVIGDFDFSGGYNAADIDLLNTQIPSTVPPVDPKFDVAPFGSPDDIIDTNDRDTWIRTLVGSNYGDTDLDGDIDTSDLTISIINFTSAGGTGKFWSDGDTDGDMDVDTLDLTTSIINFTGAAAATAIPEPGSLMLLTLGILGTFVANLRVRRRIDG